MGDGWEAVAEAAVNLFCPFIFLASMTHPLVSCTTCGVVHASLLVGDFVFFVTSS